LETIWDESLIQEINLVWHKLHGWPDSTDGLSLLKRKYIIGTLSNGNARLLIDMAKFTELPWDVIFSGDIIKSYKPHGTMYLGACEYLQLAPEKVGMVCHLRDGVDCRSPLIWGISRLRRVLD
jgi:HAD superfamily hydrolase (TIGR01493 family)